MIKRLKTFKRVKLNGCRKRQERLDFYNIQRLRERDEAQKYIQDVDEGNRLYYLATKQQPS